MILLTIDWDFFWREDPSWDFGHRESGPFWDTTIWQVRAVGGSMTGFDLRAEMEKGIDPKPEDFWKLIQNAGFNLKDAELTVSDSHMHAAEAFIGHINECDRIVNFDAHHDIAYPQPFCKDYKYVRGLWKKGMAEAGSWLGLLLHVFDFNTDIVYPSWKGMLDGKPRIREARNVNFHVFGNGSQISGGDVLALHIAKSPCWSPPWGDERFVSFVREAEKLTEREIKTLGNSDPLKIREL
jgi:hypothetical protein